MVPSDRGSEILCLWDWAEDPSEHVEIDFIPTEDPTCVTIVWSGKKLTPIRPTRLFKRGEREPAQYEVLEGTLQDLDRLLRARGEG